MSGRLLLPLMVFALSGMLAESVAATDNYSEGIHAYFANEYQTAHDRLSAAITGGMRDARCYFFRGLANYKLHRIEAAKTDFEAGARLEMAGLGTAVGQALVRVQGPERLELERHRRRARLLARHRHQDPAPTPIPRYTPQRTALVMPRAFPEISEIPLVSDESVDATDPFVNDDQPIGTGVADKGVDREKTTQDPVEEDSGAPPQVPDVRGSQRGIFGSVFRAFGKALTGSADSKSDASSLDNPQNDALDVDFLDEDPF